MAKAYISPYSSLNFRHDWTNHNQIMTCYMQPFLPTDNIRLQYNNPVTAPFNFSAVVTNLESSEVESFPSVLVSTSLGFLTYDIVITGLPNGLYKCVISRNTAVVLELGVSYFRICDSLPDTVLISYTNYRNEFDTIFTGLSFDFRVEGTFLPNEHSFQADTEEFRDQRYWQEQLSAFPYEPQILTVGGDHGVPNWVGRKLNDIFCLSQVLVDGLPFVRSDGSVPEQTELMPDYPRYIYKITLERNTEEIEGVEVEFIKVFGRVTDINSGAPVPGIDIDIYSTSSPVNKVGVPTTDSDGRYTYNWGVSRFFYNFFFSSLTFTANDPSSQYASKTIVITSPSYNDAINYGIEVNFTLGNIGVLATEDFKLISLEDNTTLIRLS